MHSCYHVATYKKAYGHFLKPIDGPDMRLKQGLPTIYPPSHKQPGRLKTLRRRELDEPSKNACKMKKTYLVMKCRTSISRRDPNEVKMEHGTQKSSAALGIRK